MKVLLKLVERSVKSAQRETEPEMRDMRKAVREDLERARTEAAAIRKDMESDTKRNQFRVYFCT